ncbi:MAG: SulP family inorganic anion transporter [Desulfobacterales bacterium]|nr:SulP family inorganic anion transporter [Desulfobacterales bacterium]
MAQRIFPFLEWFQNYRFDSFKSDAVAGLTVALVLIPQSMAYAQLAGLPAYYGLYASFLPPLVAALFGSSRQLATGPVAVVSLLTAVTLEPLATAGSQGYIAYAVMLTLIIGVIQFSLGILRLGIVINFLSLPVINGFTNAAAIIIASSQLPKLFGVDIDKALNHLDTIVGLFKAVAADTHGPTLMMGLLAFVIMYGLKRLVPRVPGILVAVVVTSLLSWGLDFYRETSVDLPAVQSQEVNKLIQLYNREMLSVQSLSSNRSELTRELNRAAKTLHPLKALELKHQIAVLTHHVDTQKKQAAGYREKLRGFYLAGVRSPGGSLLLWLKNEVPRDSQSDGRTWRIQIDKQTILTDSIRLTSGGKVVGFVPKGLPAVSFPRMEFHTVLHLLTFAAIISLLGFMEAISIAKAMAAKTGQRIDPNQELIGQGLANIFGSFTSSYPTSGSFSRSAVNLQTGAISGLSGVITGLAVALVLLFFTPLLYYLPQSVLAAIIMVAVIDLINISGFIHAWQAQWYDGAISIITFVGTLVSAPHLDRGIFIGVGLSLLVFLYKSMRPATASLSLYDDEALHDAVTFCLQECRLMEVVRFDGPLFFANATYLEDQINMHRQTKKELKHIIIYANSINDLDATGEEALSLIVDRVRSAGVDISFAGANRSVMAVFKRTHLLFKIGEDHFYPTIEKAISAVHAQTHSENEEKMCPLTTVCRLPGSESEV